MTTVDAAPEAFAVTVGFEGSRAVLGVRGEADLFRAPDLRALLHAVSAKGHRSVILDLAGLTFIDASGLRVIADSANHLRKSGGKLTVRSPSAIFRRTPRAQALGINAILSSPLLTEERPVGALNIYSRSVAAFAPKDQELAAVFATEASAILTRAGMDVTEDQLAERLGDALRTRQIIAEAMGVIMEREGINEDGAYTLLREFSQSSNVPLRERAADVVASTKRTPDELRLGPSDGEHG